MTYISREDQERMAFKAGFDFAIMHVLCGPCAPWKVFGRPFRLAVEWPEGKPEHGLMGHVYSQLHEEATRHGFPLGTDGPRFEDDLESLPVPKEVTAVAGCDCGGLSMHRPDCSIWRLSYEQAVTNISDARGKLLRWTATLGTSFRGRDL